MPELAERLLRYELDQPPSPRFLRRDPTRPRSLRLLPTDRTPASRLETTFGPAEGAGPPRRARLQNAGLIAADAVAALLSVGLVAALTRLQATSGGIAAVLFVVFAFARLAGLNDKDALVLRRATLDEAPRLAELSALSACAYWLTLPEGPGRAALLWLMLALFASLVVSRSALRALLNRCLPAERCLFIGDLDVVALLRGKIDGGAANARIVGALPMRDPGGAFLTGVDDLRAFVRDERIARLILAPSSSSSRDTLELIRIAKDVGVQVSIFPRLFEVVGTAVEFEDLEGITLMGVRRFGLSPTSRLLKRGFDIAAASIALLATAPLFAVIALAVRLESAGPILFRQQRVGREGQPFAILKFRSMVDGAEDQKASLRELNETEGLFKISADPRVTRVGRLLRKTSLDELPQLLNVLVGNMSLVGPRPLVLDEDRQVIGLDRRRLHLTPGMTGPWQVMRSGRVPMSEMVAIDYLYVSSWSLWNDFKLLLRTVTYVFAARGL